MESRFLTIRKRPPIRKDKDITQKLASAKWVSLFTVLINVVTVFTLVAIFPSKMSIVNAKMSTVNAAQTICFFSNKPSFQAFTPDGQYAGAMYSTDGVKMANMTITFTGQATVSRSDKGKLTAVNFQSTALPNTRYSSFLRDLTGTGLATDGNVNTTLNDFRVNLQDGGQIHFIAGFFHASQGQQIMGAFDINGGADNRTNGAWIVSPASADPS
ncbi:MAG TPA: hypothetical protein VGL94_24340 [Ktedonobacteraceae bacterium]